MVEIRTRVCHGEGLMLVLKWDSCRIHGLKITSKPRMGFLCLIHGLRGIGEEARGLAREKVLL